MDGHLLDAPQGSNAVGRGLTHLAGWIASGCAVVVAAGLALIFAASLVVIAVMASALVAFAGFAMRTRRVATARARSGPQYLEARRVGHSWVAYGWDRR